MRSPKQRKTGRQPLRQPRPNFIRAWRKYRGLTLEALGELVDLTASTISQIERLESGYSWESLEDIADALGCTTADLLSGPPEASDAEFLAEWRKVPSRNRGKALNAVKLFREED